MTSSCDSEDTGQIASGYVQRLRAPAVNRRTLLKYSAGLTGALALPVSHATPVAARQATPTPAPPNASDNSRIQGVSSQAVYRLPEDHQWHGGGIYATGLLEEWFYWTGFFTDDDTGEQFGLFYNIIREATSATDLHYRAFFSFGDFQTQGFTWAYQVMDVPLTSGPPPGSTTPADFQYSAQAANTTFRTTYLAAPDTWSLQFNSVASDGSTRVGLDLQLSNQTPYGYMPMTPFGLENENTPWNGQPFDPTTMYSLSYYYGGPKTNTRGTITIGDRVRRVTGSVWYEHQWGNFVPTQLPWMSSYVWSAYQFDDGSIFSFRQWYDSDVQPQFNQNRYNYSTPDGGTTYGYGEAVQWQGVQTWQSPATGRNYPAYGVVTTPFGTWYHTPIIENYEMQLNSSTTLWEGPCLLHSGSINGPVIGKAYVELPNNLTANYPAIPASTT